MIRKLSRCRLLSLILLPQIGPQRIEEDLAAAGNIRSLFHEKGYDKKVHFDEKARQQIAALIRYPSQPQ